MKFITRLFSRNKEMDAAMEHGPEGLKGGRPAPLDPELQAILEEKGLELHYDEETGTTHVEGPSFPGYPYYQHLEGIRAAVTSRDYRRGAEMAKASLPLLQKWQEKPDPEGKRYRGLSIPALDKGGTMAAFIGDRETLEEMRSLVARFDELAEYRETVEDHFTDMALFDRLRAHIDKHPGCLQNSLKKALGESDGRRVSRLVSYLEKGGDIRREKTGKTYALFPARPS